MDNIYLFKSSDASGSSTPTPPPTKKSPTPAPTKKSVPTPVPKPTPSKTPTPKPKTPTPAPKPTPPSPTPKPKPTPPSPNDPAIDNLVAYCKRNKIPFPADVFVLPPSGTPEGCPNSPSSDKPLSCSHYYTWDNFGKAVKLFNTYAIPYEELCWGSTGAGRDPNKCISTEIVNSIDKCIAQPQCKWGKDSGSPTCSCHSSTYAGAKACPTPPPPPPKPTPPSPKKRLFLKLGTTDEENITNLKIIASFFSSVFRETFYNACKEHLGGCQSCSGGEAKNYSDLTSCGCQSCLPPCCAELVKNTKCTDWLNNTLTGTNCWFGRGAVQLSYVGGYGKVAEVLKNLPINEIIPNIDKKTKFNTYFIQNPDSMCTNGVIAFLTSIAYFSTFFPQDGIEVCHMWMRGEKELDGFDLAFQCVKGGGAGNAPCRGYIYDDAMKQFKIDTSGSHPQPTTECTSTGTGCCTPKQYFSKSDEDKIYFPILS